MEDLPHPTPPPLPVQGSVLQGFFPGLGCQGPMQIVTYGPDLLAVNRPEVPPTPARVVLVCWSGSRNSEEHFTDWITGLL